MTGEELRRKHAALDAESDEANRVMMCLRTLINQHNRVRWTPVEEAFSKAWKEIADQKRAAEARLEALHE